MLANLIKGCISFVLLLLITACLGGVSSRNAAERAESFDYALEGNVTATWTPEAVTEFTQLPGDSWFIKWNEFDGEISGIFEGPWGEIKILGTNDGDYREIYGVPANPLGPLGVDRVEFAFDGGELNDKVTVAFVAYKNEQVEHTLTIYPALLAPVISNEKEGNQLQSSIFMHEKENVKEL